MQVGGIDRVLCRPAAKRDCARDNVDISDGSDMSCDIDVDATCATVRADDVCCKVVFSDISKKITVPVAVGAGSKLHAYSCVITLHSIVASEDGCITVTPEPISAERPQDGVLIGDFFDHNDQLDDFEASCLLSKHAETVWTLPVASPCLDRLQDLV